MTTRQKRHEKIRNNPANVRFEVAVTWLLSFGFVERDAKGSHIVLTHPDWDGKLTMQDHKGYAKAYQVRQALKAIEEIHHV
jgi:predicted RNA binding protein YcfA (HicA-like mRNA interferase family)